MRLFTLISCIFSVTALSGAALADGGVAKPNLVLKEIVEGLPGDSTSEVRVLTASFKPGDKTVTHTHDYPVTVYIVEGAFTLELKGQPPKTIKAGEAMVEPPNTEMTGYNLSATEETKVVIFYVSTPDGPFLKPLK
ncbi:MAG: cupin domain-containing protein [Aestuariivirga sp.]